MIEIIYRKVFNDKKEKNRERERDTEATDCKLLTMDFLLDEKLLKATMVNERTCHASSF
jgi:hypothetical protein